MAVRYSGEGGAYGRREGSWAQKEGPVEEKEQMLQSEGQATPSYLQDETPRDEKPKLELLAGGGARAAGTGNARQSAPIHVHGVGCQVIGTGDLGC